MSVSKEALNKMDEEYGNSDKERLKMYSSLSLTFPDKLSGPRAHMVTSHIEQALMIENPETPKVFTGMEKIYGKYTDSLEVSDSIYTVIEVIPKFTTPEHSNLSFTYILYDNVRGVYDIKIIESYESLSETHGYMKKLGPTKYKGMKIFPNEVLYSSANHDDNMNYCLGKNAKYCYMSIAETEEDGLIVSESFAKKSAFYDIQTYEIPLNTNDILLNIYGDTNVYKCFPDIGDKVKNGKLLVKRKFSYNKLHEITSAALMKEQKTDEVYYAEPEGTVIDIGIFVNNKEALMESWRSQLHRYYLLINTYHMNLKKVLDPIINNRKNNVTLKLRSYYNKTLDYLNDNIEFSTNKNGNFEVAYLLITIAKQKHITKGSKITDRFGGKGVVVTILPDDHMPGNAEVVTSPPGVLGRANIGQSYEHELNFCSDEIVKKIKLKKSLPSKVELLFKYISDVNPEQGEELQKFYNELPNNGKLEFIKSVEQSGIYLHQMPGNGISYESMSKLYTKYNISPKNITSKRKLLSGKTGTFKSSRPVIVADKYIFILKHVPDTKFSVRSIGNVNTIGVPAKIKTDGIVSSSTPIRFGKMELFNSLTRVSPEIVARFMAAHGSNPEFREKLVSMLLTEDPLEYHDVDFPIDTPDNVTAKQFHSYFNACGLAIKNTQK